MSTRGPRRRSVAAAVAAIGALAAACGSGGAPASSSAPGASTPSSSAPTTTAPTTTAPAPPPPTSPGPPPAPQPRPDTLGRIVDHLPTARKVVALTFDAGANDAGVAGILSTLTAADAPGTFFLTGRWTELYPGEAAHLAARYPIGNHTVDHPDMTTLAPAAARAEVTAARRRIRRVTGHDPRPLFRFPYGAYDTSRLALVNALGYAAIGWTVDTLGWKGTSGGQSAASVRDRVLAGLRPGEIVLMHVGSNPTDGSTLDADALASVIAAVRARGYVLVTVPGFVEQR
jgi:peptidoglycan/xylan/chitin deacetylase (PgdA/CDA1 family)